MEKVIINSYEEFEKLVGQQIGREFRDNMRQCRLDTVDSFHHDIFKCTGGCILYITQRHPRQLVTAGFSYICEYRKRCFM